MQENGPSRKQLKCSYYDRNGHLVDHCFYLHRFPVGHKLHGKNVKPKKLVAHNIHVNTMEPIKGASTFTTEEYDQLMALLQKENGRDQSFVNNASIITPIYNNVQYGPHSTLYWIVDSGATDHVSKSPLSQNKMEVAHDLVELPHGSQTEIKSIRYIKLSFDLILDGVLHVPKFRVNLLLVSKPTQALKCNMTFYLDFCVV